jgi:hypothetical protein
VSTQSPSAQLIAKANRQEAKLGKALEELQRVGMIIKRSDLPSEIKFRLYSALTSEHELINHEQERINGLRKAAEISRGPQWITSGDK